MVHNQTHRKRSLCNLIIIRETFTVQNSFAYKKTIAQIKRLYHLNLAVPKITSFII